MRTASLDSGQSAVRALRHELRAADDQKIMRITAMLDAVSGTVEKQAILEPLRPRLRTIKPPRPLRFVRLLFTPLDLLIRPANKWQPGEATVPRTVLMPISRVVQAGLGPEASLIDASLAGHTADAVQLITEIGGTIWPRAAEILVASSCPADWSETGLPPALYPALVQAVAAVLRRASRLRSLLRDSEVAVLEANERTISEIVQDITREPAAGQEMIAQLVLLQSPRAAPLLRQLMTTGQAKKETAILHQAMARGTEQALIQIESDAGSVEDIRSGPLAGVGEQVRRVTALLDDLGRDSGVAAHRPRLQAIRQKLDQACRARFAEALTEGLVQPLASACGPLDGAHQLELETCIRDLRTLETAVRPIGGSATYDALLVQASESVRIAAQAGTLTPVRKFRLIELLSGPEAAMAMYKSAAVNS